MDSVKVRDSVRVRSWSRLRVCFRVIASTKFRKEIG
jgi:hypothetical protein